jgi:hypothetical protein
LELRVQAAGEYTVGVVQNNSNNSNNNSNISSNSPKGAKNFVGADKLSWGYSSSGQRGHDGKMKDYGQYFHHTRLSSAGAL